MLYYIYDDNKVLSSPFFKSNSMSRAILYDFFVQLLVAKGMNY